MSEVKWQRIAARRASLQKSIQFAAGAFELGRYFDLPGIANQLYLYDGRTTYVYFGQEDFDKYLLSFKKKVWQLKFVEELAKRQKLVYEKSLDQAREAVSNLDGKTVNELFVLHKKLEDMWADFYSYGWMPVFLSSLEEAVMEYVTENAGNQKEAHEVMVMLSRPGQVTPIMAAERAVLELVSDMKKGVVEGVVEEKAGEAAVKFGWMSVYDFDDRPRESDYYVAEAKKMVKEGVDAEDKLAVLDKEYLENEQKYKDYLDDVDDELTKAQIELLHISGYIRDIREEMRDEMTILVGEVYEKMAKELDCTLDEIIQLTTTEIEEAIKDKKKRLELRDRACVRQRGYALVQKPKGQQVLDSEGDIKKVEAEVSTRLDGEELSGQVAFAGKSPVRGVVKVVMSGREVGKVNDGDILVASMTKPDFIGAMKKAAAFVTDEGGITCHAAIVAREMKKPCVIGTKIATRVLKDGDEVEVDANKGIVKKLS